MVGACAAHAVGPREMNDAELDEVCAKGSAGFDLSSVAIHDMLLSFSRESSLGLVSGSGRFQIESSAMGSGQTRISIGGQPVGTGTMTTGAEAPTISIQTVRGTVRITGDLDVAVDAVPQTLQAIERNGLVIPRTPAESVLRGGIVSGGRR